MSFSFALKSNVIREIEDHIRNKGISSYSELTEDAAVKNNLEWFCCVARKSGYFIRFISRENMKLAEGFLSFSDFHRYKTGYSKSKTLEIPDFPPLGCRSSDFFAVPLPEPHNKKELYFFREQMFYLIASRFRHVNPESKDMPDDNPYVIFRYINHAHIMEILLLKVQDGRTDYFVFSKNDSELCGRFTLEKGEILDYTHLKMDITKSFFEQEYLTLTDWLMKYHLEAGPSSLSRKVPKQALKNLIRENA